MIGVYRLLIGRWDSRRAVTKISVEITRRVSCSMNIIPFPACSERIIDRGMN
ncbi:unnamed protein product [Penicillium camemberti]|uniref:Str. FM013 n=1 Tax=Penicillium camemberti (strain FM 013) TaxID=1429867 RepID=A0A0G4PM61_PENC3|nr:unnamed protein product [Penicillium camemberti]